MAAESGTHTHSGHDHGPGHAHAHGRGATRSRLLIALILAFVYMLAEVVGGLWTGSLALLADAGHMLSDVAALALALFAAWVASRPSGLRWTYGRARAEILAALAQGVALVAVAVFVVLEAVKRLGDPPPVVGLGMLAIASGGLLVNLASLMILHKGKNESLNVRGAWLHVMADALGSVGAMLAGALIWAFGWTWADPAASLLICALIVWSAWHLIREAVDILMEAAPQHVDPDAILEALCSMAGVRSVHDLHVWTLGSQQIALSCHVVVGGGEAGASLLSQAYNLLGSRFGIDHATIQVEPETFADESPRSVCNGGCDNSLDTHTAHAEGRHAH
jgi:cobalt-zinc-cadmium efflux system protein